MVANTPEYLVSHGKTGVLGRFLSASNDILVRGDKVIVQGDRGLSVGVVLCATTERHARMLDGTGVGQMLRRFVHEDEAAHHKVHQREQQIFEASQAGAAKLQLPMEILDCELSLDGSRAIVQYLLAGSCDPSALVERLAAQFNVDVWLENLAMPVEDEHHGGCGEPNCGKVDGGGGCTTCSSGGGCSSCGSGKVDMRAYFGHLREQIDVKGRQPLL